MATTNLDYPALQERVGHYLFGTRTGFTADQEADIDDCIHDGLRRVYAIHNWSFLRPIRDVSIVQDTAEIEMPNAFDSVANDSDLTYTSSPDQWYPAIQWRHDNTIRKLQAANANTGRPVFYSVRTVTFDPEVGSRKIIVLYPTPDQNYSVKVPMILRPLLIDDTDLYPIGGEVLSPAILEACLSAAEQNFEEREHVHEKRFLELIGLAIRDDQERSSPTTLGSDGSRMGIGGDSYRMREQRIGQLTFDGDPL